VIKYWTTRLGTVALLAAVAAASTAADDPKPENKLIGTWKLVSAKYGGKESKLPETATNLKHVTPTQFMWVTYDKDGVVTRAAGGSYILKGEDYTETPEYGVSGDFEQIKGKSHSFKWKIDGAKWRHTGKLADGFEIDEVWERVEKK
jgi:hypothetical protein